MPPTATFLSPRVRLAILLIALLIVSMAFQGTRGLWEPDEGRYTDVAVEMIYLDDWVEPHLSLEQHHWTKPPLTYWSVAASLKWLGHSELAARMTSALAFFGTAVLLGLLGQIFLPRTPWIAAPMYAAALLPFIASNLVTTDTLLTFWECLGVYAYCRATWHQPCRRRKEWLLVMWGAFALAFLTKGPPGLLPLVSIVAFTLWTPRIRATTGLAAGWGLLVFLAIALPWYIVVISRNPGLLGYFLGEEIVARVASDTFSRNGEWYGAFKVYVPTLIVGLLPWTGWWLRAAWRGLVSVRRQGRQGLRSLDERQRFLLWWLLFPLAVFFLARSRLPLYLLPLAAPLVLVSARELMRKPAFPSRLACWLLAAWLVLLLVMRAVTGWVPTPKDARATAELLHQQGITRCDEIAFYEIRPALGLRFYMNCEIESVPDAELADELAERERRYWAVSHELAAQFEDRMHAAHVNVERVAEIPGQWLLYREIGTAAP